MPHTRALCITKQSRTLAKSSHPRMNVLQKTWIPYAIVAAAILIAHGPILLMDGIYWDDWVFRDFVLRGDWAGNYEHYRVLGEPGIGLVLWFIGSIGRAELTYHVLSVTLLIANGILIMRIARSLGRMSTLEAAIIGIVAGAYPAVEVSFTFIVTVYYLMLCTLLLGVECFLQARKKSGVAHWVWRIASLLLFLFSFQHNSLLVFYGVFFLLLILDEWKRSGRSLVRSGCQTALRYPEFVVGPFAFWLINDWMFPRIYFYNKFNLTFGNIKAGTLAFISKGLMEQVREVGRTLVAYPNLGIAAAVAGAVLMWLWRGKAARALSEHRTLIIIAAAAVVFLFSIAPYVLVSKGARAHGYTTRHALLVGVPVGIAVVGILRPMVRRSWSTVVGAAIFSVLFFSCSAALWGHYANWQARWVKDRSFMLSMVEHPERKSIGTFFIEDKFPLIIGENYRFFDWSSMFTEAWGEQGYSGFTGAGPTKEFPDWERDQQQPAWYNVEGYPRSPCEAALTIEPGPLVQGKTSFDIARAYMRHRFFGTEEEMNAFLRGVTTITVKPDPRLCST